MDRLSSGIYALLSTELLLEAERSKSPRCPMKRLTRLSKPLSSASTLLFLKFLSLTRTLLPIFSSFPTVLRLTRRTPRKERPSISSLSLKMVASSSGIPVSAIKIRSRSVKLLVRSSPGSLLNPLYNWLDLMVLATLASVEFFSTPIRPLLLSLLALMKVTLSSLTGHKLKLLDLDRPLMSTKPKINWSADTSILSVIIDLVWLSNALPSMMICSSQSTTSTSASGKLLLRKWKSLSSDLNTPSLPTTPVELSPPPDLVSSSLLSKMVSTFGISRINPISPLRPWALPPPLLSSNSNSLSKVWRELSLWPTVTRWVS